MILPFCFHRPCTITEGSPVHGLVLSKPGCSKDHVCLLNMAKKQKSWLLAMKKFAVQSAVETHVSLASFFATTRMLFAKLIVICDTGKERHDRT